MEADTSIWDCTFIVTDVETTGSDPVRDRITEIACIAVNGGEIVAEYSSLINPHKQIPSFIVNMTGITQEMVSKAPEASKVVHEATKLFKMKDVVFAAHNVRFDYSFVQNTFQRQSEYFDFPQLCTLKLARKMLPKDIKKNVGSLAKYFRINLINRHRAFGDAEATAYILIELLEKAYCEYNIRTVEELLLFQNKQPNSNKSQIETYSRLEQQIKMLPDSPGVYYFYDNNNDLIYIGKARSLSDKINSYFSINEINSKKVTDILGNIYRIDYKETNSELTALLLEANEIKKLNPKFNTKLKKFRSFPFIKLSKNNQNIVEKTYSIENDGAEYFGPLTNRFYADDVIELINKKFDLINFRHTNQFDIFRDIDKICNSIRNFLTGNNQTIIDELKQEMMDHSNNKDFESASRIRDLINEIEHISQNKISDSINDNNLILLTPSSPREKLVEVTFIRFGVVCRNLIIGRKADTGFVKDIIREIYFTQSNININNDTLDDLRIISSWLYKHKNIGKFIYINSRAIESIYKEFQSVLSNFDFYDFLS